MVHDLADAGTPRPRALRSAAQRHSRCISSASESSRSGETSVFSAEYPGSLAEDLGADKRPWGAQSGRKRFARGVDYHLLYKKFLIERGATHFLAPQIEGAEGKIAVATARQLGLPVMVPIGLPLAYGQLFSPPTLTRVCRLTQRRAKTWFQNRPSSSNVIESPRCRRNPLRKISRRSMVTMNSSAMIRLQLPERLVGLLRKAAERPDLFVPDQIRASLLNNLPTLRDRWWGLRTSRAAREFDIGELAALPKRFIYYPLQVSPEASINTPAPYYVDQIRAIDALRLAMPPDCALVVKEHWAGIGFRSIDFVRRLRKLPGVLVAKYTINSRELILRASLTCAVTGTAAFEAFLLGRPGLALGPGLSHWALGSGGTTGSLRDEIAARIDKPIPDQTVIERVATLLSVRYPFLFVSPFYPGEPMLRRGNMRRMYEALIDHLARLDAHAARSGKARARAS